MQKYTIEDLRWLMASYSRPDIYGPSRRVFRYGLEKAAAILHDFGGHNGAKWRVGYKDGRGIVGIWSLAHYPSVDGSAVRNVPMRSKVL